MPVAETHNTYAQEVYTILKAAGVRVSLDASNESMGKKIRLAKTERLPYFVVIGDKEVEARGVTLESRSGTSTTMNLDALVQMISEEIRTKQIV